jgi:CheY-like chemotaxis protein
MRPQEMNEISEKIESPKFILIGEDDKDDEELLIEMFAAVDSSFSIIFINNGQQALSYLQNLKQDLPCLILLDYNMPIMNGAEILQALKSEPRFARVPKVIWSTSTSESFRKICLDAGANDYIIKPSNVNELKEIIRYMLSFC